MKHRDLTPRQQLAVRSKVYRLLKDIGFEYEGREGYGFWWRRLPNTALRVCVGFDVPNKCLGGRTEWIWQTGKIGEEPPFGYHHSAHTSAKFATVQRIIDNTLEWIYHAGSLNGSVAEIEKREALKLRVQEALNF